MAIILLTQEIHLEKAKRLVELEVELVEVELEAAFKTSTAGVSRL